jgi:SulP family sulfate permease
MSGLTFGFTGSYIFSQTIFTFRTGVHSRWIGFLIMCVFLYVVVSPMNILQVAPLFFLGSTLIFIGYDLLYEWVSSTALLDGVVGL